ncbi:hypothetical protein HZ992_14775 [Rhizobacter sp. AJA081-3]|uniref:hypothetical protein n=1 Tax=Rhizobacter sp. AJA081-3 TaxID=2753607 RepID=UPI001ADF86A8|nr:hypothetical protein [Rhizobacter sp. AJA081-3]QTN21448.1 hypothetical protein HZ992_14775 [Rhizobacter sp. AJA081-3]
MHLLQHLLALAIVAVPTMSDAQVQQFSEGQVWHYRTRASEPNSTLLINKVEVQPKLGEVFHVSVRDVRVRNKHAPGGMSTELPHFPVSRTTLQASVTKLVGTAPVNPEYREGYETWRKAFEEGNAGVFTISVAEIVSNVESIINK